MRLGYVPDMSQEMRPIRRRACCARRLAGGHLRTSGGHLGDSTVSAWSVILSLEMSGGLGRVRFTTAGKLRSVLEAESLIRSGGWGEPGQGVVVASRRNLRRASYGRQPSPSRAGNVHRPRTGDHRDHIRVRQPRSSDRHHLRRPPHVAARGVQPRRTRGNLVSERPEPSDSLRRSPSMPVFPLAQVRGAAEVVP